MFHHHPDIQMTRRFRISFDLDLDFQAIPLAGQRVNPDQLFPEAVEQFIALQALEALRDHLAVMYDSEKGSGWLPAQMQNILHQITRAALTENTGIPRIAVGETAILPAFPIRISHQASALPFILDKTTGRIVGWDQSSDIPVPQGASCQYQILEKDSQRNLMFNVIVMGRDEHELNKIEQIAAELKENNLAIDSLVIFALSDRPRVTTQICEKIVERCALAFPFCPLVVWALFTPAYPILPL